MQPLIFPELLSGIPAADNVNINPLLLESYIKLITELETLTVPGDDEQYGSSVLADINVLQALSRRIHYGKFVAESKFRSDEQRYRTLVDNGDAEGVLVLLTNQAVEDRVLERSKIKAKTYGRDPGDEAPKIDQKVRPDEIKAVYREMVIPFTKRVEVDYLFLRCGKQPPGREGGGIL